MTDHHIVKWCALCGKDHPHTIKRHGIDGKNRPFTVTDDVCVSCRERMDESAKRLAFLRVGLS